jgi:glutaredoxin
MITVYTKHLCGYCDMAKAYLKKCDIPYEEINIDDNKEAQDFIVAEGHYTAPQIYHEGKLLIDGGCNGLTSLSANEIKERMGNFDLGDLSL